MKLTGTNRSKSQSKAPSEKGSGAGEPYGWEALLRASGQVIYECGPAGEMSFWGDVKGLLGCSASDIPGDRKEWLRRIHSDDLLCLNEIGAKLAEGKSRISEYRFCRNDGSVVYLRDTSCRIRKNGRLCLTGFLQDISEQHQQSAQYRHLQKMEVFGKLTSGIAHDFNNLLTVFHGYTELLQAGILPNDPRTEFLEEMVGAVERAKTLTAQLLNFSRIRTDAPRPVRLAGVLPEFYKMLRRIIGENIELVTEIDEKSGWVMADPRQIEVVIINLVVNACEAMPKGGRLAIELAKRGRYVQIVISDSGIGMEKAVLSRILKPTVSKNSPSQLPGLGLPTCLQIIEHCGGKITAESTPGKGTTFRISLPRIEPPSKEDADNNAPFQGTSLSGKGEKVLIVEDDSSVQATVAAMARGLGYHVVCAANGNEALRILKREHEIRLVICDLVMPLMGGSELAEAIRRHWPGLRILLTSGYASASPLTITQKLNNTAFLPKPLSRGVLAGKLRELLDV